MARFTQQTYWLVKKATLQLILFLFVGSIFSSCQKSNDPRDAENIRAISGNYYLQKADYLTEYYLVKYNSDTKSMERINTKPLQLIDWKGNHIYITTERIDFLDINTKEAIPKSLQNSTTEEVAMRTNFQLKEPLIAWEILYKKSSGNSKYYQIVIGLTVISFLAFTVIYFIRLNSSKVA